MDLRIDGQLPGKRPNKSPLAIMIDEAGERKTPMQMQRSEEQQKVGNQKSIKAVKDAAKATVESAVKAGTSISPSPKSIAVLASEEMKTPIGTFNLKTLDQESSSNGQSM